MFSMKVYRAGRDVEISKRNAARKLLENVLHDSADISIRDVRLSIEREQLRVHNITSVPLEVGTLRNDFASN